MEQAVWKYINFALWRSRRNARTSVPLAEQTVDWRCPKDPEWMITKGQPLDYILYDIRGGGRVPTEGHVKAASDACDELFAFCMEKLQSASPAPEDPMRYLCEVVFKNKYFFADYLTREDFYKGRFKHNESEESARNNMDIIDVSPYLLYVANTEIQVRPEELVSNLIPSGLPFGLF